MPCGVTFITNDEAPCIPVQYRGYGELSILLIEFNEAAFNHGIIMTDIHWAFDTAIYDGWFNEGAGQHKDKYLLIGFDRKGNPLEILYNVIDNDTINVFHAMPCRPMFHHLIPKGENNGSND